MNNKYSIILGNLGNTCDRFCKSYKSNPTSKVMLPVKKMKDISKNNKSLKETDYLKFVEKSKNEIVFSLASGDYQFSF